MWNKTFSFLFVNHTDGAKGRWDSRHYIILSILFSFNLRGRQGRIGRLDNPFNRIFLERFRPRRRREFRKSFRTFVMASFSANSARHFFFCFFDFFFFLNFLLFDFLASRLTGPRRFSRMRMRMGDASSIILSSWSWPVGMKSSSWSNRPSSTKRKPSPRPFTRIRLRCFRFSRFVTLFLRVFFFPPRRRRIHHDGIRRSYSSIQRTLDVRINRVGMSWTSCRSLSLNSASSSASINAAHTSPSKIAAKTNLCNKHNHYELLKNINIIKLG